MFLLINLYVNPKKQPEPYRFVGRNQEMKNKSNGAHGTSWNALSSEESQCPGLVRHKERSHRKHPTPALSKSCYAFPALSLGVLPCLLSALSASQDPCSSSLFLNLYSLTQLLQHQ